MSDWLTLWSAHSEPLNDLILYVELQVFGRKIPLQLTADSMGCNRVVGEAHLLARQSSLHHGSVIALVSGHGHALVALLDATKWARPSAG